MYHQFKTYHSFKKKTFQFNLIDVMNDDVNYHVNEKSK